METKLKFNLPREKSSIIKVVGVGGGGGNAVNHMFEQGIKGVDFIICNTDLQALETSPIVNKIQLGASLTQGLGAGANPEIGKKAAMEAIEDIIDTLGVNTKMLFITAGMGGGTGTGAAPIIAKTAREMDILTVGIVTTPFQFEGKKRKNYADEGLENLKRAVDCLLIISNDKIKEMYGNLPLREAFGHANNILTTAAKGIAEIITHPGYINVDFEDVKTVMRGSGVALMGSGMASGESRAINAVKAALASPLLNDNDIKGSKNILLNITSGTEEILMEELEQISSYIQNESGLTAELIFGTSYDENLGESISVTLIATGFESRPRENKVIVGYTESSGMPKVVVTAQPDTPSLWSGPFSTHEEASQDLFDKDEPVKMMLEDEQREDEEPEEENETEPAMRLELRVEESIEEEVWNETEESESGEMQTDEVRMELQDDEQLSSRIQQIIRNELNTNISNVPVMPTNQDSSPEPEEQDKKIEKHIQRIKELKNLNITITTPQGLRDLEKEPAYKRRNKRLEDVPHSSEQQISRLTLFEDQSSGRTEIKTNNSFLHDNVD